MELKLEKYSYVELKELARKMELEIKKTKKEMMDDILDAFNQYEKYKTKKFDKYKRIKKLGDKGKDGLVYLVQCDNKEYAMKTFRENRSSLLIKKEAELQRKAAEVGISPGVIAVNTVFNYIVMELMDKNLLDIMKKQNKMLKKNQQIQLIRIFKKLDEIGVFHSDPNPLNFMVKNRKMYVIDFGFATSIDANVIKKYGKTPNLSLMTLGFILKLKDLGCPRESYQYMMEFLDKGKLAEFGII